LYLAVGLGSAIGGTLRWWLSAVLYSPPGTAFPWGTLLVNASGSLLIGCYAALVAPGGCRSDGPRLRLFIMTGLCGGYTTFSIFSLETLTLLQLGRHGLAAANVGGSLLLWLVSVWLGYQVVSSMRRAA
jgi:CrcB protein